MKDDINPSYTVYYHLNKTDGKVYFGITCRKPETRWSNGTQYSYNKHFNAAIKKYGWDGFYHRILIEGLTKEVAELIETNVIKWSNSTNMEYGYNLRMGGGSHGKASEQTLAKLRGRKRSDESRRKMSESHKGVPLSEATKQKLSEINRGKKKHTDEFKKRASERMKNRVVSDETRRKLSEYNKGNVHSPETRKKISESNKGRIRTDIERERLSASLLSRYGKRFLCVETGEIFLGLRAAGEAKGIKSFWNISNACCGVYETCGGYHWEYLEGEENERYPNRLRR